MTTASGPYLPNQLPDFGCPYPSFVQPGNRIGTELFIERLFFDLFLQAFDRYLAALRVCLWPGQLPFLL